MPKMRYCGHCLSLLLCNMANLTKQMPFLTCRSVWKARRSRFKLHLPNVFCHLSEIILHLANAFGGTSNTVCPFVDFVFHLSEIQNVDCTLHFSQLTLSILQVKTWNAWVKNVQVKVSKVQFRMSKSKYQKCKSTNVKVKISKAQITRAPSTTANTLSTTIADSTKFGKDLLDSNRDRTTADPWMLKKSGPISSGSDLVVD